MGSRFKHLPNVVFDDRVILDQDLEVVRSNPVVLVLVLLCLGQVLAPGAARAATSAKTSAGTSAGTSATDSTKSALIDTMVVSAEQIEPFRSKIRIVNERDQEELQRFMPLNLTEALTSIPGVDVEKTGPWASRPTVRGLSGNRVLVMVDGVRLNSSRGHGAQPSIVGMESVENVEVSMGSASTEHGTDAMGGVVNIMTRRPLLSGLRMFEGRVTQSAENPGNASKTSSVLRYRSEHLGLEVSGGISELNSLKTAQGEVDNSGFRQENYGLRGEVGAGPFKADIQHTYGAAKDIGLPAFATQAGGDAEYPLRDRRLTRYQIDVEGDGWRPDFQIMGAHQDYYTQYIETTVDTVSFHANPVFISTSADHSEITSSTDTWEPTLVFDGPVRLKLFGQYHYDETEGPGSLETTNVMIQSGFTTRDTTITENVPPATRRGLSGGANLMIPWDLLQIEAGIRYDDFHTTADSTEASRTSAQDLKEYDYSYSLGLSREFYTEGGTRWQPYFSYNTGFRSANLDERYFNGYIHGGLRVFGNDELKYEYSKNYEAGLVVNDLFGGTLKNLRVSVYRSNVEDMISLKYLGMLFGRARFQYQNINNARIDGLEVSTTVKHGPARLELGGSFPDGKDLDTDEPIPDIGRASVTARLSYLLSTEGLRPTLSFRYKYFDTVEGVNGQLNSGATSTADLELVGHYKSVRGAFAIKNLFDEFYAQQLAIIPEAGRTFAFSLSSDFYTFLD